MWVIRWSSICILILSISSSITMKIIRAPEHKPEHLAYSETQHNRRLLDRLEQVVPPDPTDAVAMARFVVHRALWASMATVSTIPKVKGFPFSNIVSMSDGTIRKPTGNPYFYLTPLDYASKDTTSDNRCTISVSLEQTSYCREQLLDPDDPRCARVYITGRVERMKNDTEEYTMAKNALFTRHPSMIDLPENHGFYVAKLNVIQIVMLDHFGGAINIDLDQYFAYDPKKKRY